MYCFESDIHKNLASGAGDEDKEAAELSADFSRRVDSSNNQQTNDLPDFRSFVSLDNKLTDAKSTATVAAESSGFELKRLNTARSRAELNQSQASTAHKSSYSSLPVFSTWTKPKQESSSPPTKSHTWQELSSQINRFAEENMRNAGWEDLWTSNTKKPQEEVDVALSYLSTQSLDAICKTEVVFQDSLESQQKLQAWDKKMGLKRCHSRTMTKSSITRKKLLQSIGKLKTQKE